MDWPRHIKEALASTISDMELHAEEFVARPGRDFTRQRKLGFSDTMLFLVTSSVGTLYSELLEHFEYDVDMPSASALVQRRSLLRQEAFGHLLDAMNRLFLPASLFDGAYQLIACDGSSFDIARNELDSDTYHPPSGKSKRGYNAVHLTALHDVLEKRFLDAVMQGKRKSNEYAALCTLVDRFRPCGGGTPIFIADRGFASYNVFAHMIENDSLFLIRASDKRVERMLGVKGLGDCAFDVRFERLLIRSAAKRWRDADKDAKGAYRVLARESPFDYLGDEPGETYAIKLRIARFELPGGGWENVVTNLGEDEFDLKGLEDLYDLRWGIELAFRDYKHTIGASELRSGKLPFVEQELWARMILYNACTIIAGHVVVVQDPARKHVYKINFTIAAKVCRYFLRLKEGRSPPDVEVLIASNLQPIRLGRKYNRQKRFRFPSAFGYRFV
jgi:hypothetical protein